MSNQSSSSAYSEKKIAAYESLFKESSFAKPQEVYLTITVGHLFGQAYIMEQQGTKEGDPVYSRFLCNLEDITKVYINDNVKASPLFIQCDTDVKGVVHRKRIIVPCLDNVASIVEQIKEVRALHMEKFEAAQEIEKQKKREELEAARRKEQIEREAKEKIPPLPVVEKLKDIDVPTPSVKKPSAAELNKDVAESLKSLEAIEIAVSKPAAKPVAVQTAPVKETPKAEVVKEAPKSEAVKETPKAEPVKETPKPAPMRINPQGRASSLEEFEAAVKKLKEKKDSGAISEAEFAEEKKKLLATLY